MEEPIDMQKLNFFTEGNTFTGSRTKDKAAGTLLRYLVRPDLENGRLLAYAWTCDLCFERAPEKQEAEFPLNEEGIETIQNWLHEQYVRL